MYQVIHDDAQFGPLGSYSIDSGLKRAAAVGLSGANGAISEAAVLF